MTYNPSIHRDDRFIRYQGPAYSLYDVTEKNRSDYQKTISLFMTGTTAPQEERTFSVRKDEEYLHARLPIKKIKAAPNQTPHTYHNKLALPNYTQNSSHQPIIYHPKHNLFVFVIANQIFTLSLKGTSSSPSCLYSIRSENFTIHSISINDSGNQILIILDAVYPHGRTKYCAGFRLEKEGDHFKTLTRDAELFQYDFESDLAELPIAKNNDDFYFVHRTGQMIKMSQGTRLDPTNYFFPAPIRKLEVFSSNSVKKAIALDDAAHLYLVNFSKEGPDQIRTDPTTHYINMKWSPNGRFFAALTKPADGGSAEIHFWDTKTTKPKLILKHSLNQQTQYNLFWSDNLIVTTGSNGTICLLGIRETETKQPCLQVFAQEQRKVSHPSPLTFAALEKKQPNGTRFLVTASHDGSEIAYVMEIHPFKDPLPVKTIECANHFFRHQQIR